MKKDNNKFYSIKSLDKALNLLEFLSLSEHEIGVAKISKKINMSLSTVYRLLTTLKNRGYVIQNQKTSKYKLGIKLFELSYKVQSTKNLIRTARPYIQNLSKMTNETVNLAILEGNEVIYLDTIKSVEILRTEIVPGTRIPAHCTALGKALLAFLSESDFNKLYKSGDPLTSLTTNSISSLDELKRKLKNVKEQGYAFDREEFMTGINCVGVPVFGKEEAIAAISITGPASRFIREKMEKEKDILISTSKEISYSFYTM